MIVGRSTDYTGPGKVKTRSEDWFIAAGAGRDAAKAGKGREANPYVPTAQTGGRGARAGSVRRCTVRT